MASFRRPLVAIKRANNARGSSISSITTGVLASLVSRIRLRSSWASARAIAARSWSPLAVSPAIARAGASTSAWARAQRYRHRQPVAIRIAAVLPSPRPCPRTGAIHCIGAVCPDCFSVAMAPALMSPTAVRLVGLVWPLLPGPLLLRFALAALHLRYRVSTAGLAGGSQPVVRPWRQGKSDQNLRT
jgi:hypothetical protein